MLGFELRSADAKTLPLSSSLDCFKGTCATQGPDIAAGIFCGKSKDPVLVLTLPLTKGLLWDEWWPPQRCAHVLSLTTCEYYLIWLKNEYYRAKDVISNFGRRRLSWFIQMGPTRHHKCPYKKKIKGDNTDGRWEHREPHRGVGKWRQSRELQPQAKECWQPLEAGRGKEGFFPRVCWQGERMHFCGFELPSL